MSDPSDLSNLRDIVVPPDVPLWPPAPGWWVVGAAVLAGAAVLTAMAIVRYRRDAYRRAALDELAGVEALPPVDAAQRISEVLKRAALAAYARADVAALTGEPWLAFLDRTGRTDAFTAGPSRVLLSMAYGGTGDARALPAIAEAARGWLRRHRC